MTDELDRRMDTRLTAAGERWRATQTQQTDDAVAERAARTVTAAPPRRRNRIVLVASAAVVAAALVAGAVVTLSQLGNSHDDAAGGTANLIGTVWKLDADMGGSDATLYVGMDGHLVADDECTIVGAKVDDHGTKLRATDLQIRHRDCTDQYGPRLGDEFAKVLRTNPGYTAKRTTLTVGDYDFTAAPELPRPTIDVPTWEDAVWRLVDASNAVGRTLPRAGLRVYRGKLSANDSCNDYFGKVDRNGSRVTSPGIRATPIGRVDPIDCSTGLSIKEIIESPFSASINGNLLTVTRKGVGQLTYRWIPDDPSAIDIDRLVGPTWRPATPASRQVGWRPKSTA